MLADFVGERWVAMMAAQLDCEQVVELDVYKAVSWAVWKVDYLVAVSVVV